MAVNILSGAVLATMLMAPAVGAQSLDQIGGPASLPPPGFQGQQFVDSRGCLFLRAGYGKNVNWVARVDRNHKPICNLSPTGSAAAQAAVAADMAPDPLAAAQAPAGQAQAPILQAPILQAPILQAPAAQAPVPQGNLFALLAPAPQGPGPSAAPKPTIFTSPAPAKVAAAAPMQQMAPAYQASTYVGPSAAPVVVQAAPSQGADVSMISVQVAPVPVSAPPQPTAASLRVLPKPPKGWVYAWKDDRLNPLRGIGTLQGEAQQDQVWQRTIPMVLVGDPLPQTAWQRAFGIHPKAKTARVAGPTAAAGQRTTVSTMSAEPALPIAAPVAAAPAPLATGTLRIQVGCFADPANAQGAASRLAALGLHVSTAQISRNGKDLQIVYAGPFGSTAEASQRLVAVQGAGFADAFLR